MQRLRAAPPRRDPPSHERRVGPHQQRTTPQVGRAVQHPGRATTGGADLAFSNSRDIRPRSRGAIAHEFCSILPLKKQRAQEAPGARCTRSLACSEKSTRVIHHRFTEHSGVSCAMVLRLIPCSPRRTGLSCHRRPRKNSRELDTSVWVPGPHGFAVRRGICGRWIRNSPRLDQLERIHAPVPQGALVRFGPTGY